MPMRPKRFAPIALTAALLLTATGSRALACPNCKEAVASQPGDSAGMARGYNFSVMVMLAVPFTLLSAGGFAMARAVKRGVLPEM